MAMANKLGDTSLSATIPGDARLGGSESIRSQYFATLSWELDGISSEMGPELAAIREEIELYWHDDRTPIEPGPRAAGALPAVRVQVDCGAQERAG